MKMSLKFRITTLAILATLGGSTLYRVAINVCTLYLNEKLTMKANSDWLEKMSILSIDEKEFFKLSYTSVACSLAEQRSRTFGHLFSDLVKRVFFFPNIFINTHKVQFLILILNLFEF